MAARLAVFGHQHRESFCSANAALAGVQQFSSGDEGDEFINFGVNVADYPKWWSRSVTKAGATPADFKAQAICTSIG